MTNGAYGNDPEEEAGLTATFPQLRDPIGVLKRGWHWGVVSALVIGGVAFAAVQLVPLQYEASASLLMAAKRIPDRYVPTTIEGQMSEQLAAIKGEILTRRVLSEIIEKTGLYREAAETVPMDRLADRLKSQLAIEYQANERAESTIVRVRLRGEDPTSVAAAVNEVSARLIDANLVYRSEQSRLTTAFMRREFERADAELRTHQRRLAEFREAHRGSLPEQQEATIARLERLESQRRSAILQINELRSRIAMADAQGGSMVDDEGGDLASLQAQLVRLSGIYTEEHPSLISLRRRIEALEQDQATPSPTTPSAVGLAIKDSGRREIEAATARLAEIDEEVTRLEALIEKTADITEEYGALSRKEMILNESYTEYLRKLKDSELAQSLENSQQGARLSRIEAAIPPQSPVIPRWQFNAVAILFGLGFGAVTCVLRDLIFPVVIDEDDLANLTGVPIIGTIPKAA